MKISVIIPIYNVESYVLQCLKSVAEQTMTDGVECILVDDCGTDASMQVVDRFLNEYQGEDGVQKIEFKILHHPQNKGLSCARNTGLLEAKGDYIFFLDSDDELADGCLESLYELAKRYDADMVQGTYVSDSRILSSFGDSLPVFSDEALYVKSLMLDYDRFPVMAQNRLVRRSILMDNRIYFKEGIIHEDDHWTFFLAKYVTRLVICTQPTYVYRSTPGSITNAPDFEKDRESFRVIIADFCKHIDPVARGSQMCDIFLHLHRMRCICEARNDSSFQESMMLFLPYNTFIQQILIRCAFLAEKGGLVSRKCVNLLQRIYRRY